jgi:spore coat polysaccharide biosynthesis protein SpsF
MKKYQTEQEAFWAGKFGDAYVQRNEDQNFIASNVAFFAQALRRTVKVDSAIEAGANVGLNMVALRRLFPSIKLAAVEINPTAVQKLKKIPDVKVHTGSLLEFKPKQSYDLAFIKGVLIHINPDALPQAYAMLYRASRRYILIAEYYNPTPVEISYRGHQGRLFKRDFAGEMRARYRDLELVDYGFVYRGDPKHPQDDLTWFLLEKG